MNQNTVKMRPRSKANMPMSQEEYEKKLAEKNPNVEVIDTYINAKTPIKHRCKLCGKEYMSAPTNVLHARACKECAYKLGGQKLRKTNAQFLKELESRPEIKPLEEYINANTAISFQCQKCGYIWSTTPTLVLSGTGCPECGKRRKTNEEFLLELAEINPMLEPLEPYVLSNQPIQMLCKQCGHIWKVQPSQILRGHGCPKCANLRITLSEQDFLRRVQQTGKDLSLLDSYVNSYTPVQVHCNKCGHTWSATPGNLIKSANCPNCARIIQTRTNEQYTTELHDKSIPITPLEEYKNAVTKIWHQCDRCGYQWQVMPDALLQGHGCPKCADVQVGLQRRLTQDEFLQRVQAVHGNTIVPLEPYQTIDTKIKFHCNQCGNEWLADPNHIFRGHGCWICNSSSGERNISIYLDNHNILYESQKTYSDLKGIGKKSIRYDFYLSDYNTLIEYNGIQHYEPVEYFGGEEKFKLQLEHDRRKYEYAESHQMQLLIIKYTEDVTTVLDNFFNNLNSKSVETVIPA